MHQEIWAILGGLMSVLFRLQPGYPDSSFPILQDLLGSEWAKRRGLRPEDGLLTLR
jgi:cytochrome c oxidase subunit 1